MSSILSATNLARHFNGLKAVDGIDFAVPRGQCFGFLGPNGAGKTTTIKMIYGMLPPSGGELFVFGLPVQKHLREIKRRLGVVMQKDILEETVSAWDNMIMQGLYYGFSKDTIRKRGESLLGMLQLLDRAKVCVGQTATFLARQDWWSGPYDIFFADPPYAALDELEILIHAWRPGLLSGEATIMI